MTTLDTVVAGLKTAGYKVNLQPQEKMQNKDIVITLEDLKIETETSSSYFITSTYGLTFASDSIVDIATVVPAIINIIDKTAVGTMRDFQSISPDINKQDGTLYLITMKFSFKEVINIS